MSDSQSVRSDRMRDKIKGQLDKLRAEASRGAVPSSVVFALTDPIMDEISRKPRQFSCCGYSRNGEHNASCTFYGEGAPDDE